MDEPEPEKKTERVITPESVPQIESDQVCEQATPFVIEGAFVELEGWEESPPPPQPHRGGREDD